MIEHRYLVIGLICLPLTLGGGCSRTSERGNALAIWHSTNLPPRQVVLAVSKLIPVGATREEVEAVLGPHGVWTHFHGPTRYVYKEEGKLIDRPGSDLNLWTLDYAVSGGAVSLLFKKRSNQNLREEFIYIGAEFRRELGN